MLDAIFSFPASLFILGDPCRLLQIHPKLFGFRLDQLGNHALLNNRITARTKSRAEKYVLNVSTSATVTVQQVIRLTISTDLAANRNVCISRKFTTDAPV